MQQQLRLLFGRSAAVAQMLDLCARLAPTRYPVLLLGEPGTGKTVLAQHLHDLSGRAGPFIKESAPNIPDQLAIAHLEGCSRGAYTGATADRIGLIEAAHSGSFFLDEIGVASAALQQLLLRLLDDHSLRRLGEVRERPVDVRFILATNADLDRMVREGAFRRDLLSRFGYFTIQLPPLAQRRDEIVPLAQWFVAAAAIAIGRAFTPSLSAEVCECFQIAPWPKNIRELKHVCEYAVIQVDRDRPITLSDLPPKFLTALDESPGGFCRPLAERVREALLATKGNKTAAAKLVGVSARHVHRLLKNGRATG